MPHREVSKDEFFNAMNARDVIVSIEGRFPFTAIFETRGRLEAGRIVEFLPLVKGEPQKRYMLSDNLSKYPNLGKT